MVFARLDAAGARLNGFLERHMALCIPLCMTVGILFADFFGRGTQLVPFLFAALTFIGALKSGFADLWGALCRPLPLIVILLLVHVWMPALACGAGKLFFGENSNLVCGIVLEFAVPTAVVSLMWSSICGGDAALGLSLILIDTLLAPTVVPLTLRVLVGSQVHMDTAGMMRQLVFMIALPALAALSVNQLSRRRAGELLAPRLAPVSKLCLMMVVSINASKVAPFFRQLSGVYIAVAGVILVLAASGYLWGILAARLFRMEREKTVAVAFGSGMRNISAGAVIAAQFFPAEVLFPVMIGTLFQQVLAALCGKYLLRRSKTEK